MNISRRNRKAISPVLATVILIAITLIAAIAIAGFVFGLFGSFTSNATISANAIACQSRATNGTNAYCKIILTNSGSSPATVQSCSFSGTGGGVGTVYNGGTVNAGSTRTIGCAAPASFTLGIGTSISGSVALSNGGSALFSSALT